MCKVWFPGSYRANAEAFLKEPAEALDVGFSLALRRIAGQSGQPQAAVTWLCSDSVQELLVETARLLHTHSLDAERKAAEAVGLEVRFSFSVMNWLGNRD